MIIVPESAKTMGKTTRKNSEKVKELESAKEREAAKEQETVMEQEKANAEDRTEYDFGLR